MLTYGSVCSGIEAATVAWHGLGWRPAWFAEIEPFPSAVLAHHYPTVPNLGDMTKIAARILSGEIEAPDVLVGGTPCQAFSLPGFRLSLGDDRGRLSLSFVRLADAIDVIRARAGKPPAVVLWENVPGVLNVKDNAFGGFLAAVVGESVELEPTGPGWTDAGVVYGPRRTAAWRVLDAQYFGLAQRRRRVFVAASARKGLDSAALLFESEGMRRDDAPGRSQGENAPGPTVGSPDQADDITAFGGNNTVGPIDLAPALLAQPGSGYKVDFESETFVVQGGRVRRLTPREFERLQGLPDDYTAIAFNGKPAADGPRYTAVGNSMPVPVMHWLGARIDRHLARGAV